MRPSLASNSSNFSIKWLKYEILDTFWEFWMALNWCLEFSICRNEWIIQIFDLNIQSKCNHWSYIAIAKQKLLIVLLQEVSQMEIFQILWVAKFVFLDWVNDFLNWLHQLISLILFELSLSIDLGENISGVQTSTRNISHLFLFNQIANTKGLKIETLLSWCSNFNTKHCSHFCFFN